MKKLCKKNGQPAICISQISEDEERENAIRFEKQKSMIIPKPYNYNKIIEYLNERCELEEKKLSPVQIEIFKENLRYNSNYDAENFSPIFFHVTRKKKDSSPYDPFSDENEEIYIYIEKSSGYFETNSIWLSRGLSEVRGVTKEEYEHNSNRLFELIGSRYSRLYEEIPIDI